MTLSHIIYSSIPMTHMYTHDILPYLNVTNQQKILEDKKTRGIKDQRNHFH